jgi:hypothetical protein
MKRNVYFVVIIHFWHIWQSKLFDCWELTLLPGQSEAYLYLAQFKFKWQPVIFTLWTRSCVAILWAIFCPRTRKSSMNSSGIWADAVFCLRSTSTSYAARTNNCPFCPETIWESWIDVCCSIKNCFMKMILSFFCNPYDSSNHKFLQYL